MASTTTVGACFVPGSTVAHMSRPGAVQAHWGCRHQSPRPVRMPPSSMPLRSEPSISRKN